MRAGKVLLVMVAVLAMAGAAGAQIFAVNADRVTEEILFADLGPGTVTGICDNGIRSAANALVGNLHYSENIQDPGFMVVVDLSDCSRTVYTRDYAVSDSNNKLAAKFDGTVWEIDRAGELWQLTFTSGTNTVSRVSEKVFNQAFGGGGDFAWGPDGLLYIASNETDVGNFIWDETTDTLTSLGSGDGAYNYQGIAWYEGKLYGATAGGNPPGSSGPGKIFELNPSNMSILSDELASYEGRLNDLAAWPLEEPCETDLIAGGGGDGGEIVGTVSVVNNGDGTFNVTYQTFGSWEITEVHFDAACDPSEFPTAGKGNPIPGQFCYTDYPPEGSQSFTISEPVSAEDCQGTPCGDTCAFYAAHAVVVDTADCDLMTLECRTETAWGDGPDFPGRNWATYFFCNCD